MHSFAHINYFQSSKNLTSYLNSARPFSYKDAVISGALFSATFVTIMSAHVPYKYTNSTSNRKLLSKNGFSDIDFLHDVRILAVRRRFRLFCQFFTAHAQFDHIITFGLKSDVTSEFCAPVFLLRRSRFRRAIPFLVTFVMIMSSHAQ